MSNVNYGKFRKSTTYEVTFPTMANRTAPPLQIELIQKANHHDVLTLKFGTTMPLWFENMNTGLPVQLDWSQNGEKNTWHGYVSFISRVAAAQRKTDMHVVCIGSSFPMKERASRVFKNQSIPQAVATIAKEHGFRFVGDNHSRLFDQLVMSGHSYWEFIQEQAKRIGYGVLVVGTDLHFKPIDSFLNEFASNVPVLDLFNTDAVSYNMLEDRTLDHFKVLKGDHIESGHHHRTTKHTAGVNPLTGKVFTSKSTPSSMGKSLKKATADTLFEEQTSEQVVNSPTAAKSAADGAAQLARFNLPAHVICQGDPRIHPFRQVYIDGTGPQTDGHWIVKEATHIINRAGDYQMELQIATDGIGSNNATPFRSAAKNEAGVIDLDSLSLDSSDNHLAVTTAKTKLAAKKPILKEHKQGYKKTPTKWKTTAPKPASKTFRKKK